MITAGHRQSDFESDVIKGFSIRLSIFSLPPIRVRNMADLRRAKIRFLEVYEDGKTVLMLSHRPFARSLQARGTYTDEMLQRIDGFTPLHLELVQTARQGDAALQRFIAKLNGWKPDSKEISYIYEPISTRD